MFNSSELTERRVLDMIIQLLLENKITTEDIQFKNNNEREVNDDDRWFDYVERDGWKFQGHKAGRRIRLLNASGVRVAKAPQKDDFVKECRRLLSETL